MSEHQHPNLAAALAALQGELPTIAKRQKAEVTSNKGSYSYDYADLADVSVAVMPLLSRHGLAFSATPTFSESGQFVLECTLLHASGESRTGRYPLPSSGTPQSIGSAITYGRRYCLCAATGVAPEDDDDGAAAEAEQQASKGTARRAATPRQQQGQASGNGTAQRASAKKAAPAGPAPPLPGEEADAAPTPAASSPPSAYSKSGNRPAGADEPITQAQSGKLHASFKDAGVTDRAEGLAYVASVIGREVDSTKNLTKKEASDVIEALSATPPPADDELGPGADGW